MATAASVEIKKQQVIDVLNKVAAYKGKPPERVVPRKILERMTEVDGWDDKVKGFAHPNDLQELRAKLVELDGKRGKGTDEENAKVEREFRENEAEFNAKFNEWFQKPVFVPWDRQERRWIWEQFRKEYEGECNLGREDALIEIAKALGKSGEIEDLIAEAIEESEKKDEETTEDPAKPELVKT